MSSKRIFEHYDTLTTDLPMALNTVRAGTKSPVVDEQITNASSTMHGTLAGAKNVKFKV